MADDQFSAPTSASRYVAEATRYDIRTDVAPISFSQTNISGSGGITHTDGLRCRILHVYKGTAGFEGLLLTYGAQVP